ncbi:hypothetical protein ACS0KD_003030 [Vibrio vulnificus]|nr:hypothetical protein [Vibrio vulnificus]
MALQATVNHNGMSGKLYLTIITCQNDKFGEETSFLLRGFESREKLYSHIEGKIEGNIIAFEKRYFMPLVDLNQPDWPQIYDWLKLNHFTDAVDVIE